MLKRFLLAILCFALLAACTGAPRPAAPLRSESVSAALPITGNFAQAFIPNAGQSAAEVLFQTGMGMGTIFFTANQVWLSLAQQSLAVEFLDANPDVAVAGTQPMAGRANYLLGNNPARWQTALPLYTHVTYTDLYPGVDLDYTAQAGRLKGTYTLAPGANPALIRWTYRQSDDVTLDAATGDLTLTLGARQISELAPSAWQTVRGQRREVAVRYTLAEDGRVGFALGDYDARLPLVIDPFLVYATYFGGDGFDTAFKVAVDAQQNVYAVGYTTSTNFPGAGQPQPDFGGGSLLGDVFILKLNAAGNAVVYATYLGGSENDMGDSIALDANGAMYLSGVTYSDDFPLRNAYQSNFNQGMQTCSTPPCPDAFVAKLNAAGDALVFSTYLGGGSYENGGLSDGGDARSGSSGIDVDAAGNVYVTGMTASSDFPMANAYAAAIGIGTKAFFSKLSADGQQLLYSTFVQGPTGNEYSAGIAVVDASHVYVAGSTTSPDFPTRNPLQAASGGYQDVFIMQFDTTQSGDASLTYSTYFGGDADDACYALALDGSGNLYLAGDSLSSNLPMQGAYQNFNASVVAGDPLPRDAWVAKIAASGDTLLYSTYLGGDNNDVAYGLDVTPQGNIFLGGYTTSRNFPLKAHWDAYLDTLDRDAFVARIDPTQTGDNSLIYSTYIGGDLSSETTYGVTVDAALNVYLVGRSGWSALDDTFAYDAVLGTVAYDGGFVMKLSPTIYRTYLPLGSR
ncbi:MAG TPA: SBBP repeat-containing protein [Anaerolineae bacterium]|nr:SBBP repeat-containing protein [Anaerolineae bacterium]